jgi:hypothetical protein
MKTVTVLERPDAPHRHAAIVHRAAGALQEPPIELPAEHAIYVARKRNFLHGNIDVLSFAGLETLV